MSRDNQEWPIFVINLQDVTRRREAISAQLQAMDLTATIIEAVDGRNGLPAEYEAMIDRDICGRELHYSMVDAEYACALSHHAIYQRIIDENLEGAVILEDDAKLQDGFKEFIKNRCYLEADFIQMDYLKVRVWLHGSKKILPVHKLWRLAENVGLATGYSVSYKAAKFLLDATTPVGLPADWPCDLKPLAPTAIHPRIVDHPDFLNGDSFIEPTRDTLSRHANQFKSVGFSRRLTKAYWKRWWMKRRCRVIM